MDNFYHPNLSTALLSSHSGKWTVEEKEYADALAAEFEAGVLAIEEGISLRRFLSQSLHCSAKRISKKYEGSDYNGKLLYQKCDRIISSDEAKGRREKLQRLEKKYQESLKVLKMVEDSKQQGRAKPPTLHHAALHNMGLGGASHPLGPSSFLHQPSLGPTPASLLGLQLRGGGGGGGLFSQHLLTHGGRTGTTCTPHVGSTSLQSTDSSLLQAAFMTKTHGLPTGFPLPPSSAMRRLSSDKAAVEVGPIVTRAGSPSSSLADVGALRRQMGVALTAASSLRVPGPPSLGVHREGAPITLERRLGSTGPMIGNGLRPNQPMILPNTISSLNRGESSSMAGIGGAALEETSASSVGGGPSSTKKAQQNALILAALMKRKTPHLIKTPAEEDGNLVAPTKKRQRICDDDFALPPTSAKFARFL